MNRLFHPSTRHHSHAKDGRVPSPNRSAFCLRMGVFFSVIFTQLITLGLVFCLESRALAQAQPKKDDLQIDPEKLPNWFKAPSKPPAMMDVELRIASDAELDKLKKEVQKFSKVKTDCDTSETGRKIIQASVRYRLASMTKLTTAEMRDDPKKLPQMRQEFVREISTYGTPAKRPQDIAATAKVVYEEVRKQIPELLKNNFYVRLQAVLILNEIDYKLAYVPTYELLLQVIQAPDIHVDEANGQPEPLKIYAVKGLIRIMRFAGECPVKDRNVIVSAMIEELNKKDQNGKFEAYWWRQVRMLDALRYSGISGVDAGNNNKPYLVEALLSILKDPNRDWQVRSKASYVLGRVPIPDTVKNDVVNAIAEFALSLAQEAAANPKNPIWKGCFWDLYLTFRPNNLPRDPDQDGEQKRDGGLLAAPSMKAAAQPAYELIVPLVSDLLSGKSPDAGNVKKLTDFVRARVQVQAQNRN